MRIYLDEDSTDHYLELALVKAGHEVVLPIQVGMVKKSDPEHFLYALTNQLPLLTANYDDFILLDRLVLFSGGHHPGILVIRKDNDKKRDMRPSHIVQALTNAIKSLTSVNDQLVILNHWR